jgi:hypothetical protein
LLKIAGGTPAPMLESVSLAGAAWLQRSGGSRENGRIWRELA